MIGTYGSLLSRSAAFRLAKATTARHMSTGLVFNRPMSAQLQRSIRLTGQRTAGAALIHQFNVRRYTTDESANPPAVEGSTSATQNMLEQITQTTSPDTLVQAAAQIGDFKAMGLCNFTPVGALEAMMEVLHVTSGLPWWGSIAVATVLVRLALLPLMIKIQRNNAKLMNINPDVTRIMDNLKKAQQEGDAMATGKYTHEIQDLFKKNNCHPMKSLGLPLVQMPVMISFFMALRAMAELPVPGMSTGGMAWFTDLTAQDPYYILPVASAAGVMLVLEAGTEAGAATPQSKGMKNLFRGLTVLMVPFTAWMPSSVFVYWVTSNAFSIGQILALKNPTVRKALNIPPLVKPAKELQKNSKSFMENFRDQQKHYDKLEKDRVLRERQQAAAMARRASKRRF